MEKRYKLILSGRNIYREIELPSDARNEIKIGTKIECDERLRREHFFEEFEISLFKTECWCLTCSDNLYISQGDSRKLLTRKMAHGDSVELRYQESDIELLKVDFLIDFDYEEKIYDTAVDIRGAASVLIGGRSDANLVLHDDYVNQDCFSIVNKNGTFYVKDIASQYGLRVNEARLTGERELRDNDFVSLAAVTFCYKDGWLYCDSSKLQRVNGVNSKAVNAGTNCLKYPKFNRSTRVKTVIPTDSISVLDPPPAPNKPSENIVMKLLPAILMLAVTVVLRGIMSTSGGAYIWVSVFSMSIGIVTSTVTIVSDKKKYKKETSERIEKYTAYIDEKREFIEKCRQEEENLLNSAFTSTEAQVKMVDSFSETLFDRKPVDEDYLVLRLGQGEQAAAREIDYKVKEELECNDDLMKKPEIISEEYYLVHNVPITLDLKQNNTIGVVGNRQDLYEYLKVLAVDLAVHQYYLDTQMFFILGQEDEQRFGWLRLLPHVNNEALNQRNISFDSDGQGALLEYLFRELSVREEKNVSYPNLVVFIYRDNGFKLHPVSKFIEKAVKVGVNFIFFEEQKELLPMWCDSIVALNGDNGSVVDSNNRNNIRNFACCRISDEEAGKLVTKLAPVYCEEVTLEGSLTKNITLFELLNILNAQDIDLRKNWAESEVYKSMAAPLGVKSKNDIVSLDLNEKKHGPHGLVAGTTGSGKSEILQSYILSMATRFHPYEVGFVIIDFKGGGMVNQFKDLPHLIGSITNIDGREIDRSLSSIKAELRKRQELFAEYNVNHIDAYIKLFKKGETKIPLPHLILIVDEFAELKMDQPEFMKELISAARIGRSLGVHLILATQKPSGVVDSQIWSNSKFKLCLKVQSSEDSNEVLKSPVAAEIKEPGRAYLQVGNNEIFELFQSAYSGAPAIYDESSRQKPFTIYALDLSGRHTPVYSRKINASLDEQQTQLAALTEYISEYCKTNGIKRLPGICLPPLPENIMFSNEGAGKLTADSEIGINLGMYDDPDSQYQGPYYLNISTGHSIIIGSSQYGKTNLLQLICRSLAMNYSPCEVNLYILDFASMALKVFEGLNHVGGVVTPSEDEKLKNFFRLINKEMAKRKELFASMGITSFGSYKEAGKTDLPQIVILIDNLLAFRELYEEYEEDLIGICREGISVGICLVVTSMQTSGINYKYMSNFSNRLCMSCNQSEEYATVFDRCRIAPKNVPGRCIVEMDKDIYEMQSYLAFEGSREIERVTAIKSFIREIKEKYQNSHAKRIPEVPKVVNEEFIKENYTDSAPYLLPVGVNYETVDFVSAELDNITTIALTGKKGNGAIGFTNYVVNYLYRNIFNFESKLYIIDSYEQKLKGFADLGITERYSVDIHELDGLFMGLEQRMQQRVALVKESGRDALKNEPLIVVLVNTNDVFKADALSKETVETYKNLIKNYKGMKLLFMFSDVENVSTAFGAPDMLKTIKDVDVIVAFEDISAIKLIDINSAIVKQFKKPIEAGDAYWMTSGIEKVRIAQL